MSGIRRPNAPKSGETITSTKKFRIFTCISLFIVVVIWVQFSNASGGIPFEDDMTLLAQSHETARSISRTGTGTGVSQKRAPLHAAEGGLVPLDCADYLEKDREAAEQEDLMTFAKHLNDYKPPFWVSIPNAIKLAKGNKWPISNNELRNQRTFETGKLPQPPSIPNMEDVLPSILSAPGHSRVIIHRGDGVSRSAWDWLTPFAVSLGYDVDVWYSPLEGIYDWTIRSTCEASSMNYWTNENQHQGESPNSLNIFSKTELAGATTLNALGAYRKWFDQPIAIFKLEGTCESISKELQNGGTDVLASKKVANIWIQLGEGSATDTTKDKSAFFGQCAALDKLLKDASYIMHQKPTSQNIDATIADTCTHLPCDVWWTLSTSRRI